MILFRKDFQLQHGIAPRRKDLAGSTVVAVGDHKGIASGEKAFGDVAERPALHLEHH